MARDAGTHIPPVLKHLRRIAILPVAILTLLALGIPPGDRPTVRHAKMQEAAMRLRTEVTTGHLLFEELLGRFVRRVLRYKLAFECPLQDALAETVRLLQVALHNPVDIISNGQTAVDFLDYLLLLS